jgi:transcription elongation factor Elf1
MRNAIHLEPVVYEDEFSKLMCPRCDYLLCYGFDYDNKVKKEKLFCTACKVYWDIKPRPKKYTVLNYNRPKKIKFE